MFWVEVTIGWGCEPNYYKSTSYHDERVTLILCTLPNA